jgi:hypothetical protein
VMGDERRGLSGHGEETPSGVFSLDGATKPEDR